MLSKFPGKAYLLCSLLAAAIVVGDAGSSYALDLSFSGQNKKIANHVHTPVHDKWALLIGVELLQDGSVAEIKEADRNAKILAKTLTDPNAGRFAGDHVKIISGPGATKSGIEAASTGWLCKKVLPDDLALFYICSAGARSEQGAPLAYTYDTLSSEKDLSAVNLETLAQDIKHRTQCKNIIFALDLSPARSSAPAANLGAITTKGVSVLAASAADEASGNNSSQNCSFFVQRLTESLKQNFGGTAIKDTLAYLNQTIPQDSQAGYQRKQSPQFLASADNQSAAELSLGVLVKSSTAHRGYSLGHPLDTLALEHPELTGPRGTFHAGAPAPILTSRSGATDAKSKPATLQKPAKAAEQTQPKKAPAKDEDDEEDDDAQAANVDYKDYMAKMKQDIQKRWTPPKGLESRKIVAMFTITRDGRILNPTIIEGAGVPDLDKSALAALSAASPLDPLPKGAPRSVDIKYSFDWHVERK